MNKIKVLNVAVIIFIILTGNCYGLKNKANKRCSEWGAIEGQNCNGTLLASYLPIIRGKIEVTSQDPFTAEYKVSIAKCFGINPFADDGCFSFPQGKSVTIDKQNIKQATSSTTKKQCDGQVDTSGIKVCAFSFKVTDSLPNEWGCDSSNAISCICAFAKHTISGDIFSDQIDNFIGNSSLKKYTIGCVPSIQLPPPPIMNEIYTPIPIINIVRPCQNNANNIPCSLQSFYQQTGSTFDTPIIQFYISIANTSNENQTYYSLSYNFSQSPTNQSCISISGMDGSYCPAITPDGSGICLINSNNGVYQNLGCVPRPSIAEYSRALIIPYYQTYITNSPINSQQTYYQSVVPILIKSTNIITPLPITIGEDVPGPTDNSESNLQIQINSNFNIVRVSNSSAPNCNIGINAGITTASSTGQEACKLNKNITATLASIYNNVSSSNSIALEQMTNIREFFLSDYQLNSSSSNSSNNTYYNYIQDIAGWSNYGVNLGDKYDIAMQAIILSSQPTLINNTNIPITYVNAVQSQNCSTNGSQCSINTQKGETNSNSNSCVTCGNCSNYSCTGDANNNSLMSIIPGGAQERIATYCYTGDKPYMCKSTPLATIMQQESSNNNANICGAPICQIQINTNANIDQKALYKKMKNAEIAERSICPGVYNGPNKISKQDESEINNINITNINLSNTSKNQTIQALNNFKQNAETPDQICIVTSNLNGWDFISGVNQPNISSTFSTMNSIVMPPQPICSTLPSVCPANLNPSQTEESVGYYYPIQCPKGYQTAPGYIKYKLTINNSSTQTQNNATNNSNSLPNGANNNSIANTELLAKDELENLVLTNIGKNITIEQIENTKYLKQYKSNIKCITPIKCIGGVYTQNENICIPSNSSNSNEFTCSSSN